MIIALSAGRDCPVELRSRLALGERSQRGLLMAPRPGVGELAILSTCHRTEIYATADGDEADAVHAVAGILPGLLPTDQHDLRLMQGSEAIEHLFRVACGLDSLVVGETQVLGQVRRAFVMAQKAGSAGPVLSNIFGRAIRLGRTVRSETALGRVAGSIGGISAEYLTSRLGSLKTKEALIVGAGEAATDAARALWKLGARVTVVSRTITSAQALASTIDGVARPFKELTAAMQDADFAVVAISGGAVISQEMVPTRSNGSPFVIVDLSIPTVVVVNGRTDIDVKTLDELPGPRGPEVTDAIIDAEALVKKEVADLKRWADTRPDVSDLRSWTESLVHDEVARSLAPMNLTGEQQASVEMLALRIANKIIHGPTTTMRNADQTTRDNIRKLFGLDG
ncbi:MAG: glutamyl-tRNA reductase [Actinomycetota bacterium]